MLQKLILFLISAILFVGCGASAPTGETPSGASETTAAVQVAESTESVTAGPAILDTEPEELPEAAEYFRFDLCTSTATADDGTVLLYETYTSPIFSSPDADRKQWVDGILNEIHQEFTINSQHLTDFAGEFLALNSMEGFYSYSNYQQLGIARHDETVASLISLSSLYSGGTHPNSVQTAFNMDISGERLLHLEDVVHEEATNRLAELVQAAVDEKFADLGEGALFEDYRETIANSMLYGNMTPYWYFNDVGLVVFYNQYELGPYAAGIIKAELPYDRLDGILLEEYVPAEPDGSDGDLVQGAGSEAFHQIPVTIDAEGEHIFIGVTGTIRQVRLSEVLWIDSTPISQQVLFSAMTMTENDALELIGGIQDESRSFAIEFQNGRGEHMLYYIHPDGLSAEP